MTYFDNYTSRIIASGSTPSDYYKNGLQQIINDKWSNASDIYTISEEQTPGLLDWQNLEVRITHVLSNNNTSDKKDDDFRQIIFQDISHTYALGIRYFFDNNYWLTDQSDIYHYPTASAIVRRCNNSLKWIDSTGTLKQEPCIIDSKVQRNRNIYGTQVETYEGYITVICQQNQFTNSFKTTQRFVFNGQAYKIMNLENYYNKTTYGLNDSPELTIIMNRDTNNNVTDDLINNIADINNLIIPYTPPPTTAGISISPQVTSITQLQSQSYSVYKLTNGVINSNTFTINPSGANPLNYQLIQIDGNHFTVLCKNYDSVNLLLTCVDNVDLTSTTISIKLESLY